MTPAPTAERTDEEARQGWQERLETSDFGRGLINSFLVLTLIAIVAVNLPSADITRKILATGRPYLNALGLDQAWTMFAPDFRHEVIDARAIASYDDGSSATWTFPHNGPLLGGYRDYRWRKWVEYEIDDANAAALWRPAALFAAARLARPARRIVTITLVRRWRKLAPPGPYPDHDSWHSFAYYRVPIGGRA